MALGLNALETTALKKVKGWTNWRNIETFLGISNPSDEQSPLFVLN